jgi:hypothetical protein
MEHGGAAIFVAIHGGPGKCRWRKPLLKAIRVRMIGGF